MKFAATLSQAKDGDEAVRCVLEDLREELDSVTVNFLVVFVSGHEESLLEVLGGRLRTVFPQAVLFGCTAEGVIGSGQELERQPALSVLAGSLPGVTLRPFHLTQDRLEMDGRWTEELLEPMNVDAVYLTLADPFNIDVRRYLEELNAARPGCRVIGGLASGGQAAGENRLLLDGAVHRDGLIGIAISGDVVVETVVSQGCRPVGRHYVVTQSDSNVVRGLRNQPAMTVLQDLAKELPEGDRELMGHGVFLGRAIDEYQSQFERGDFLIQSVIGADPKSGAIAITGEVRPGTTVQFHVRDAESADEDLRQMLQPLADGEGPPRSAALLFSCNGRGSRMWGQAGHDVGVLDEMVGPLPVSGFFCAGELGPIGGQSFIHGFTAAMAFFRPR